MERFTIDKPEEIKMGKSVCDLCFFKIDGTVEKCKKYDPKPQEYICKPDKCPWANYNPNVPWK